MADKEEGNETEPRGADWEVVSLTGSTYAAAPGPDMVDPKSGEKSDLVDTDKNETSNALFMSGHFLFPPSQHENLPLEPENTEIVGEQGGEDLASESTNEKGEKSFAKDQDNWNIEKLTESDDFRGIPFFDEKGNVLTINDVDFADSRTLPGLNLAGKEESIYNSAKFHSLHSEPITGESNIDDEDRVLAESIESSDSSVGSNVPKHTEEDNYDGSGLPYTTWWKKQAAALYAHAKEANTFWSIFIAAAVMGLVIIGQQWQQERWQVLHHRWHSGVYDEKFGRIVGPISRFKDAIVGGNRRGFSIRSRDL
ncbi:ATG8-interacting protein 2 isoform X1 [Helianthus annuus]|uniref:ATG8-interacting protein 2 isoform X1 n=1 Tax=Helianthus annuus TaxID=4232 RepID=UPI000B8F00CD|nr:ATG8-interacting protein 2 isoform X1 [Helianthus annuus]XP_035837664.1 ATG8-interacting protein 2 isoform X1 [Helianthus annuus]